MDNFIAIDVETANNQPTSICAIGAVLVMDGIIKSTFYELVRPEPNWYIRYFSTSIHGIYPDDTENCSGFSLVWSRMADTFAVYGADMETIPFVAHNKSFDEKCIRACHRIYSMTWPDNPFFCTLSAARRSIRRADIVGATHCRVWPIILASLLTITIMHRLMLLPAQKLQCVCYEFCHADYKPLPYI